MRYRNLRLTYLLTLLMSAMRLKLMYGDKALACSPACVCISRVGLLLSVVNVSDAMMNVHRVYSEARSTSHLPPTRAVSEVI